MDGQGELNELAGSVAIVLVYPLLSLILGIVWLDKAHLITRIAACLRSEMEDGNRLALRKLHRFAGKAPARIAAAGLVVPEFRADVGP